MNHVAAMLRHDGLRQGGQKEQEAASITTVGLHSAGAETRIYVRCLAKSRSQ